LNFVSARESFSRLSVLPKRGSFTSCAIPPSLQVTGMCFCTLGNILDVGAEGTVQGGDVGAVGTVVQKRRGGLWHQDQNDVVAAGTVRKIWVWPTEGVCSCCQSSVISPGLKVNDPMLEVWDGRCAGDIPPSPGCAASRPHEHTSGSAVPSGTVSDPEVKKRPPRHMVAQVFFPSSGIFARTDSLRPELPHCGTIIGMGLDGIPEDSPALAKSAKNIPEILECFTAGVEDEKGFFCAQELSPEAWEALLSVPLVCGKIMDIPLTQGRSPARGKHAENFPENQRNSSRSRLRKTKGGDRGTHPSARKI